MTSKLPVCSRASITARSLASEPLLVRYTTFERHQPALSQPLSDQNEEKRDSRAYLQGIWQVGSKLLTILMEGRVDVDACCVPQSLQLPLCSRRHFPVAPNTNI